MTNPMTCDEIADRLADYLEGDMDATTRVSLETHASSCVACSTLLSDLRRLQVDARNLAELSPTRDLWPGIAARIETPVVELSNGGTRRRRTPLWIGLTAAGLVAVTATVTRELTKRSMAVAPAVQTSSIPSKPDSTIAQRVAPATQVANADTVSSFRRSPGPPSTRLASASKPSAEQTYATEIGRLRAVLDRRRPQLDSTTVAVVEHNLRIIDDAIAQCKQALQKDPASRFLIESLNDALDTKVQLLRTAAMLPSTT